jgi:hypothetical protein
LIEVERFLGVAVREKRENFVFEFGEMKSFASEETIILTIHSVYNLCLENAKEGEICLVKLLEVLSNVFDQKEFNSDALCSILNYNIDISLNDSMTMGRDNSMSCRGIGSMVFVFMMVLMVQQSVSVSFLENTCTFRADGRLFLLTYLHKADPYYNYDLDNDTQAVFNFCEPFVPTQCPTPLAPAYSFVVTKDPANSSQVTCTAYTSDSKTSYYSSDFDNNKGNIKLNLTMQTAPEVSPQRETIFALDCEENKDPALTKIRAQMQDDDTLLIFGQTPYACPVFELSSFWVALEDNKFIIGIVMLVVGFIMLFFGILMTQLMIFLTAYFLTFIVLASLFSLLLTTESSRVAIYFALLLTIFLSTLIAYGLTRFVNVSIFFIGACTFKPI